MTDAIIAAVAGAGMFGVLLVVDEYGKRRWSTWARSAANIVVLVATPLVVVATSDRPLFALVGIAVVVITGRIVRTRSSVTPGPAEDRITR
jgi:uncharacterized membrane protein HdeD (DUF308 family)